MKTIPADKIVIPPNRQRREFREDALTELASSIISPAGLVHPIVLRNDGVTLVSGERRLRAIRGIYAQGKTIKHDGVDVPAGMVPFTVLAELSELELMEAELCENVVRKDLTWQEQCQAIADLDALRKAQNPTHTFKATAVEITGDPDVQGAQVTRLVSDSIIIAEHLSNPEVAKAKTQKEAYKTVTRILEQEFRSELSKRRKPEDIDTAHTLIKGDAVEMMRGLPAESFDCILTDPPYGIKADTVFGDMSDLDHEYSDDPETAINLYKEIAVEGYRITKPKAHLYLFCDPLWFKELYDLYESYGWWVWKAPIIWDKRNTGLLPHPDHGPRRTYECILYAIKGKRPATAVYRDIIECPNVQNKQHAAQKPVELYAQLLRRSCYPGDTVLDPCCGSGTIFPAATRESLIATGIELYEASYNLALSRIGEKGGEAKSEQEPVITDEDL